MEESLVYEEKPDGEEKEGGTPQYVGPSVEQYVASYRPPNLPDNFSDEGYHYEPLGSGSEKTKDDTKLKDLTGFTFILWCLQGLYTRFLPSPSAVNNIVQFILLCRLIGIADPQTLAERMVLASNTSFLLKDYMPPQAKDDFYEAFAKPIAANFLARRHFATDNGLSPVDFKIGIPAFEEPLFAKPYERNIVNAMQITMALWYYFLATTGLYLVLTLVPKGVYKLFKKIPGCKESSCVKPAPEHENIRALRRDMRSLIMSFEKVAALVFVPYLFFYHSEQFRKDIATVDQFHQNSTFYHGQSCQGHTAELFGFIPHLVTGKECSPQTISEFESLFAVLYGPIAYAFIQIPVAGQFAKGVMEMVIQCVKRGYCGSSDDPLPRCQALLAYCHAEKRSLLQLYNHRDKPGYIASKGFSAWFGQIFSMAFFAGDIYLLWRSDQFFNQASILNGQCNNLIDALRSDNCHGIIPLELNIRGNHSVFNVEVFSTARGLDPADPRLRTSVTSLQKTLVLAMGKFNVGLNVTMPVEHSQAFAMVSANISKLEIEALYPLLLPLCLAVFGATAIVKILPKKNTCVLSMLKYLDQVGLCFQAAASLALFLFVPLYIVDIFKMGASALNFSSHESTAPKFLMDFFVCVYSALLKKSPPAPQCNTTAEVVSFLQLDIWSDIFYTAMQVYLISAVVLLIVDLLSRHIKKLQGRAVLSPDALVETASNVSSTRSYLSLFNEGSTVDSVTEQGPRCSQSCDFTRFNDIKSKLESGLSASGYTGRSHSASQ